MNQKELKELIEFLIEKDIAEFELERGDVKVRIKRAGEAAAPAAPDHRFFTVHSAPPPSPEPGTAPVVTVLLSLPPRPHHLRPRCPRKDCILCVLPLSAPSTSRLLPDLRLL